jgi:small GTP-binding protein
MIGAYAVGKTSLVGRFVKSMYSEKYLTTVGVKIDKKSLKVGDRDMTLILWDLAGEDEFLQLRTTYLRGSAGYFLVADGTRRATLDKAIDLQKRAEGAVGKVPFILLINKSDLKNEWDIQDSDIAALTANGWAVFETSAKTGANVEEVFQLIGEKLIGD